MKIILLAVICSIAVAVWSPKKHLSFRSDGTFSVMQVISENMNFFN